MFNQKVYDLVIKILDSRLPPQTQEEIIRFYTLPRNTPIRPLIELPDEEVMKSLGTTKRPTLTDLKKKENPNYEEDETINKIYKNEK